MKRFDDIYEALEYQKDHPETNIWHFSSPHYWGASEVKPDGNPTLAKPSPIPSKQGMIDCLKRYYKRGYYWLVFVNDRWGICTSKPRFPAEVCEKYYVHGAAINQLAKVEKVKPLPKGICPLCEKHELDEGYCHYCERWAVIPAEVTNG